MTCYKKEMKRCVPGPLSPSLSSPTSFSSLLPVQPTCFPNTWQDLQSLPENVGHAPSGKTSVGGLVWLIFIKTLDKTKFLLLN